MVKVSVPGLFRRISSGMDSSSRRSGSQRRQQEEEEEKPMLLDRLGGMVVLNAIVNEFCRRAASDERLVDFFQGVDVRRLACHQKNFFAMAFTKIEMAQAEAIIRGAHGRMFACGLNESHFDIVAEILQNTLKDRGFGDAIVAEAIGVVAPLRSVFQDEARNYQQLSRRGAIVVQ